MAREDIAVTNDSADHSRASVPTWPLWRIAAPFERDALAERQIGQGSLTAWVVALRPLHWIKNLLLLAPAIFAQVAPTPLLAWHLAAGIVICSSAASAGYLWNDVADRSSDRLHSTKRFRPIAAGLLDPLHAAVAAATLCLLALLIAFVLFSPMLAALVAGYLVATVGYSGLLKRIAVLDVLVLASLYLWRLLIGGAVSGVTVSWWLLGFGFCLFVTLALAKRLDEVAATSNVHRGAVPGRAYRARDLGGLRLGAWFCGSLSIAALLAYVAFSPLAESNYRHQICLLAASALTAWWLVHILRSAATGRLRGDPVVFAASDPLSLLLAIGAGASLIASI
jgi:4-hydroxybenzoate polyprenyltransferase